MSRIKEIILTAVPNRNVSRLYVLYCDDNKKELYVVLKKKKKEK